MLSLVPSVLKFTKTSPDVGQELLVAASRAGCLPVMRSLIAAGVVPDGHPTDPPIRMAVMGCKPEAIKLLLEAGVSANRTMLHDPPILLASQFGNVKVMKTLLDAGAEWAFEAKCDTPFLRLARLGKTDALQLLLDLGANPNEKPEGALYSSLEAAARGNHARVAKCLLKAGAVVTADIVSAAIVAPTPDLLKVLLSRGYYNALEDADIRVAPLARAAVASRTASVRLLIKYNADVNRNDDIGCSPLWLAADGGHADIVQALLKAGAKRVEPIDPELLAACKDGQTELMVACRRGHYAAALVLIEDGANIHQEGFRGMTCLLHAAYGASSKLVKALLERGAKLDHVDSRKRSALAWAAVKGNVPVIDVLVNAGADPELGDILDRTSLMLAIVEGNFKAVKALIRKGAKVNRVDATGHSELILAIEHRGPEILRILIAAGANVDLHVVDGRTAITFAVNEKPFPMIKILLNAGCDVNIRDDAGKNATDWMPDNIDPSVPPMIAAAAARSSSQGP
ncbi:ankyrin repeat-containing domain protein [Aspergillus californicus]